MAPNVRPRHGTRKGGSDSELSAELTRDRRRCVRHAASPCVLASVDRVNGTWKRQRLQWSTTRPQVRDHNPMRPKQLIDRKAPKRSHDVVLRRRHLDVRLRKEILPHDQRSPAPIVESRDRAHDAVPLRQHVPALDVPARHRRALVDPRCDPVGDVVVGIHDHHVRRTDFASSHECDGELAALVSEEAGSVFPRRPTKRRCREVHLDELSMLRKTNAWFLVADHDDSEPTVRLRIHGGKRAPQQRENALVARGARRMPQ